MMSKNKKESRASRYLEVLDSRIAMFRKKVCKGIAAANVDETGTATLMALLGADGRPERLIASDMVARRKAVEVLAGIFLEHRASGPKSREYFLMTLVDDSGHSSDRLPVLRFSTLYQKASRCLRQFKLSGFAIHELHPLMNYPQGGDGRLILAHDHILVWSDEPFNHVAAEKALNGSSGLSCKLGAKPVDIRPIGRGKSSLRSVAGYMLKPPHCAKNLRPKKQDRERKELIDTTEGYRPEFALRLFEALTQVELMDLVYGVNDGKKLRQAFRERMISWHRLRPPSDHVVAKDFDTWVFWAKLRREKGSSNFFPFRIVGGSVDIRPAKPAIERERKARRPARPKRPTVPMSPFAKRQRDILRRAKKNHGGVLDQPTG